MGRVLTRRFAGIMVFCFECRGHGLEFWSDESESFPQRSFGVLDTLFARVEVVFCAFRRSLWFHSG